MRSQGMCPGRHSGPSPRGWGERVDRRGWTRTERTIPTRVGRTQTGRTQTGMEPDHPYAGGENRFGLAQRRRHPGPSPRGWGEPVPDAAIPCAQRTIPTRVGRTNLGRVDFERRADHPHAGGENQANQAQSLHHGGPSPRGWGELGNPPSIRSRKRTIPTRVGRTTPDSGTGHRSTDHPHAGGENEQITKGKLSLCGPSPRGWGERPLR